MPYFKLIFILSIWHLFYNYSTSQFVCCYGFYLNCPPRPGLGSQCVARWGGGGGKKSDALEGDVEVLVLEFSLFLHLGTVR